MKLIDRYILREMALSFLIGLFLFTFVLMMGKVLRLTELLITSGVEALTVLRLFLYILPYSLVVTIPLAALLAILATYSRLSSEGEVIALKASGLSLYRLMLPAFTLGLFAYLATSSITLVVLPESNHAFKTLVFQLASRKAALGLQEGVFNSLSDGLILYVERLEGASTLHGILIVDGRDPEMEQVAIAKEGSLLHGPDDRGLTLKLSRGTLHISPSDQPDQYRLLSFASLDLSLLKGGGTGEFGRPKGDQEMTLGELKRRIQAFKAKGLNFRPFEVELHKKFAIPFASLIFALIGTPLGIRLRKGGRGASLALSLAFALFYYILIVAGEDLGDRGKVSPALAMWTPNLLLGALGVFLVFSEGRGFSPMERLRRWMRPQPLTPNP